MDKKGISLVQLLIIGCFIVFIILSVYFFYFKSQSKLSEGESLSKNSEKDGKILNQKKLPDSLFIGANKEDLKRLDNAINTALNRT